MLEKRDMIETKQNPKVLSREAKNKWLSIEDKGSRSIVWNMTNRQLPISIGKKNLRQLSIFKIIDKI